MYAGRGESYAGRGEFVVLADFFLRVLEKDTGPRNPRVAHKDKLC